MAADPRYLELWKTKKAPSSNRSNDGPALPNGYGFTDAAPGVPRAAPKTTTPAAASSSSSSSLQVRLDTPGGLTYSPSDLSSHNVIKRMFVPYTLGQSVYKHADEAAVDGAAVLPVNGISSTAPAYDFGADLKREAEDPEISEARKYALSINIDSLAGRPEGGKAWNELHGDDEDEGDGDANAPRQDTATLSGQSRMTTASTRTTATMATLATQRADSSLPDWYMRPSAKKDVAPFVVPSAFTATPNYDSKMPWDAMRWYGHRAFERPSQRDHERGIAAFEDINGVGRAPSVMESRAAKRTDDDGASVASASTVKASTSDARSLSVADLFVLDPRISRPLRMVRRTDPRQVLLLCNGVYVSGKEVAAQKAAQAARQAGLDARDVTLVGQDPKKAAELMARLSLSATQEERGGIGILFCPTDDPLQQDGDALNAMDHRFEVNAAKRLEIAPSFGRNSERRAQLRAALAAVELASWEEEGFDKLVVGVEQGWIVRGITTDIWRWRHTGWTLNDDSPLGAPGDAVPDRDLWELLDEAVRKYEQIDCNVRFWHVSPRDASLAKRLAHIGAMKDVAQRQSLVRWRKKMAPTLAEEKARREKATAQRNHQGPTLSQVR